MGLPVDVRLVAYRGDTWSQQFRLIRDAVPVDLTGASVESWAKAEAEVIPLDAAIVDEATGMVAIGPPPAGLAARTWDYDVEVTESGGAVTTWVRGTLTVRPDVTNAVP
jgi:hypothetical protein